MSTTCGPARLLLWPGAGPRSLTAEIVAAQEHVSGCEACRGFLHDMRTIGERIERDVPRPAAPPDVRDRLFESIARARTAARTSDGATRFRRAALGGIGAALVVGLGVLGYLMSGRSPASHEAIGSIVEDQLRSQKGRGLVSSDSLQVGRWLEERLSFAVQVPLFPEARLTGARLLVDDRTSGAVMEYEAQGRRLAYYVLPGAGGGPPRQVRLESRDGYQVASWHDAGLTHALVGTQAGLRLVEYARYCIHQMMAA